MKAFQATAIVICSILIILIIGLKLTGYSIYTPATSPQPFNFFFDTFWTVPTMHPNVDQDPIITHSNNRLILQYDESINLIEVNCGSNSMLPTLNCKDKLIAYVPKKGEECFVGDIVTFETNNKRITHRIVEVGEDSLGTYYITRGDALGLALTGVRDKRMEDVAIERENDPYKIRPENIKYKIIGIIYS